MSAIWPHTLNGDGCTGMQHAVMKMCQVTTVDAQPNTTIFYTHRCDYIFSSKYYDKDKPKNKSTTAALRAIDCFRGRLVLTSHLTKSSLHNPNHYLEHTCWIWRKWIWGQSGWSFQRYYLVYRLVYTQDKDTLREICFLKAYKNVFWLKIGHFNPKAAKDAI